MFCFGESFALEDRNQIQFSTFQRGLGVRPRFIFHNYKIESYIHLEPKLPNERVDASFEYFSYFFIFHVPKSFQAFVDVDHIFGWYDTLDGLPS